LWQPAANGWIGVEEGNVWERKKGEAKVRKGIAGKWRGEVGWTSSPLQNCWDTHVDKLFVTFSKK